MKILAVADEQNLALETAVARYPDRLKGLDLIVSCGDLDTEYLEYLVDGLKKPIFFIRGNHPLENTGEFAFTARTAASSGAVRYLGGNRELHGRIEVFKGYIFAGFGGSIWYNGGENQFTEKQMSKIVKNVERAVAWQRLQDRFMKRPPKEVIVISHSPVLDIHDLPDKAHRGFKCFTDFIGKVSPILWLHGHIHLENQHVNQISVDRQSTVVNAFGCKLIDIDRKEIQVTSRIPNGI